VAHRTMEYTAIQKGRGLVYAANEQVYRRNSESNRVKYLVCINDDCKGTAKIEGSILKELNAHTNHGSMSEEISRLTLLARLRKRAAEESATTLRNIFDEETRASAAGTSVGFNDVENSMYKRRRLQQPALPSAASDVARVIEDTTYGTIDQRSFFRGQVEVGKNIS
jgi:hypothetical protein